MRNHAEERSFRSTTIVFSFFEWLLFHSRYSPFFGFAEAATLLWKFPSWATLIDFPETVLERFDKSFARLIILIHVIRLEYAIAESDKVCLRCGEWAQSKLFNLELWNKISTCLMSSAARLVRRLGLMYVRRQLPAISDRMWVCVACHK